jgi:predicted amidohydrolase YtcJ
MRSIVLRLILATFLLIVGVLISAYFYLKGNVPSLPEEQVFIHGNILTMNGNNSIVEAMILRGSQIEFLGSTEEVLKLKGATSRIYDLQGKTLVPGFIDAHGHFPGTGLRAVGIDLSSPPLGNVTSVADIQQKLETKLATLDDGEWLFGFGYDDSLLKEHRHPNRHDLDAVSTEHPIFLLHSSGHMAVVNSAGLVLANISRETPDPEGGVIGRNSDSGDPNGLLQEHATDLAASLAMDFSPSDFLAMVDDASQAYLAAGVTTVQSGGVDQSLFSGLRWLSKLQRIPQRVVVWPLSAEMSSTLLKDDFSLSDVETDKFSATAVKIIVDGSIQGYTAFLSEPYFRQPEEEAADYRGFARVSQQQLDVEVQGYYCRGYQIALHGNGDAAIQMILDAVEKARGQCARRDTRTILVHSQMARVDQLRRMKDLEISPSFFVAHTYFWGDRHRDQFLGPQRAARISPLQDALSDDLRFTLHLDSPVVPMDVGRLMWSAVTRQTRSGSALGGDQRITPLQALRGVTIDAAWQSFKEKNIGSLEVGKQADFVLLDRNPLGKNSDLLNFKVEKVWIGGRCYFELGSRHCSFAAK